MNSDLVRSDGNRKQTRRSLAQHAAFASAFGALAALIIALALDFTSVIPWLYGYRSYNPIRDFLSYQADGQSGQLMTAAFLLLATSSWSYAVGQFVTPEYRYNRITLWATFLFGLGLFVGASFPAQPGGKHSADAAIRLSSFLHDLGIVGGFVPAIAAAMVDQHRIGLGRIRGYLLTQISFWMIVVGAISTGFAVLAFKAVEGLTQRVLVIGVVLWLVTEAHQLFWKNSQE
jgi:hypothetical protein